MKLKRLAPIIQCIEKFNPLIYSSCIISLILNLNQLFMNVRLFLSISILLGMLFSSHLFGQSSPPLPNDTRWVRESEEYKSICEQTYRIAWASISKRINYNNQSVIVMDLDETVLDNSLYQVELFKKSESYSPDSWNSWVNLELSELVPGAKEFIFNYKNITKGIIVFISDRDASTLEATRNNLERLGVLSKDDIILLKQNNADSKVIRRKEVLQGIGRMETKGAKKVVAYFGDQMGDFPEDKRFRFSENKFIFPNPMYGKW